MLGMKRWPLLNALCLAWGLLAMYGHGPVQAQGAPPLQGPRAVHEQVAPAASPAPLAAVRDAAALQALLREARDELERRRSALVRTRAALRALTRAADRWQAQAAKAEAEVAAGGATGGAEKSVDPGAAPAPPVTGERGR